MTDGEIDDILKSPPPAVDPSMEAKIAASMGATMGPVRPLPPSWALTVGLIGLAAVIPTIGAGVLGFQGIRRMSGEKIGLIFSLLLLFTILAAAVSVAEMIPGSRRLVDPRTLLAASTLGMFAVFAALFHDYDMYRFLPEGLKCLAIGELIAIPTAAASWLVLRRGFAVNPTAAGVAAGTLAGVAGVIALELHCPIFRAMHVMVWHTAVILVAAGLGRKFATNGHE